MAEPWLPGEDRLALWDPLAEQVRVVGWRPGPAGVSAVELAPGLRVAVDHAAPSTLTEMTVDADDGSVPDGSLDIVARLLGDEAADVVRTLPFRGTPDRPMPLQRHPGRNGSAPGAELHHVAFAQFALGVDLADDAALSDLARAAAVLGSLAPGAALGVPGLPALARRGVDLLTGSEHVVRLSREQATRLEELVRAAKRYAPETVTDLDVQRAIARIPRGRPAAAARALREAEPMLAAMAPAPMVGELADLDVALSARARAAPEVPRGIPLHLDGDHRGWAWLDRGSNVQLTAGASAIGAWGRVFRRSDGLLLGLAPLRPSTVEAGAGRLAGLVVIPPSPDPDDLVVDIVTDPAAPRRAASHQLTRSAVGAGRLAARLTRLQDPAADLAWEDCARGWETLGDVQRTNLAVRHGKRGDSRGSGARSVDVGTGPLLADEL